MNKKILIASGAIVLGVVALLATGSFGELSSLAIRPRVVMPVSDLSYVSCQKYEKQTEYGIDTSVYLTSSKKTSYTTPTGEVIDISDAVNQTYLQKQKIAFGQNDPTLIKSEISYTTGGVTMINKVFINGQEFKCPDIDLTYASSIFEDIINSPLSCSSLLSQVPDTEKAGIVCTGERSFTVEKPSTLPQQILGSLTSSFLGNGIAPTTTEYRSSNVPTTTSPLTTNTYYPTTTYPSTTTEDYYPTTTRPPTVTTPPLKIICANGLNKQLYPTCKCPANQKIQGDKCVKKSTWERFKDGVDTNPMIIDNGNGTLTVPKWSIGWHGTF